MRAHDSQLHRAVSTRMNSWAYGDDRLLTYLLSCYHKLVRAVPSPVEAECFPYAVLLHHTRAALLSGEAHDDGCVLRPSSSMHASRAWAVAMWPYWQIGRLHARLADCTGRIIVCACSLHGHGHCTGMAMHGRVHAHVTARPSPGHLGHRMLRLGFAPGSVCSRHKLRARSSS